MIGVEFKEAWNVYEALTYQVLGKPMSFFIDQSVRLHKSKVGQELLEELEGVKDGLNKHRMNVTVDQLIGFNDYFEMTGNFVLENWCNRISLTFSLSLRLLVSNSFCESNILFQVLIEGGHQQNKTLDP